MRTNLSLPLARIASVIVCVVTLLFGSALAQTSHSGEPQKPASPNTDYQQLKERLLVLEETVKQLKAQIETIEETRRTDAATGEQISTTAAAPTTAPATTAKPQNSQGESTFTIYGFAMLDFGYQFKQEIGRA